MVQGLLFDFFGTLVIYDERRVHQRFPRTHQQLADHGVRLDEQALIRSIDQVFTRFELDARDSMLEFSMADIFTVVLNNLEVDPLTVDLEQLAHCYTQEWSADIKPIKHVQTLLRQLQREYQLGLITNTHFAPMITRLLKKFELESYFSTVVTSVEHGNSKPHPAIFQHTLETMALNVSQAIYVGDSYRADYLGAQGVGMNCFLVGKHARVPDAYQIPTVVDLPRYQISKMS
jgi:putative hydrolase of the HAD superfamily